jgi:uncharacterized protein YraI
MCGYDKFNQKIRRKEMKKGFLAIVVLLFTLSLSACNFPLLRNGGGDQDSALKTAVALDVALTQIASTLTAAAPVVIPSSALPSSAPVTETPVITQQPTLTPTLAGVWLTVQENTNCRSGPGSTYDWVTLIAGGQMAEAVARNAANDYYYVRNPNSYGSFCWLWSKYSAVTGNITTLPVFTPQPTPTVATLTPTTIPADLSVSYIGVETCPPQYAFSFKIKNTGSVVWQSLKIVVLDTTTSTTYTHESDTFKGVTGCTVGLAQGDLTNGEDSFVANVNPGQLDFNPVGSGHSFQVTITVYANDGRTGTSISKTLSITP